MALGAILFLATQLQTRQASLATVAQRAVPLEVALANGKPTLLEFYADWCTSCRSMATTMAALESEFDGQVNFVMLNVDNTKWLPELSTYRVNGIPHFEFLRAGGLSVGTAIGEQPRTILAENLTALSQGISTLSATETGETSAFEQPLGDSTQPRSHG